MVESIARIQQLLAESKFVEVQKEVELLLSLSESSESIELLKLYFESLRAQSRPLPKKLLLSLIEKLTPAKTDEAQAWLLQIHHTTPEDHQRTLLIKIKIADLKGQTDLLYRHISEYQVARYEFRVPNIPESVQALVDKYFPNDFQLKLQRLALTLMRLDLKTCEALIQDLILSCFERSSPRGTKEKLSLLFEVLSSSERLYYLELYKSLCSLLTNGIKEKKDYKKVIELIIYLEDFKFQVILLNFLVQEKLESVAISFAAEMRLNKSYDYVYLDKFLPHLKSLFFKKAAPEVMEEEALPVMDLRVSKTPKATIDDEYIPDLSEEEMLVTHMLKHQTYTTDELLDVAVSLYQSEFYHAALKASQLAFKTSSSNTQKLKASYLKITCLLKTGEFRMALDTSMEALKISQTQNDILSFMYSQAEAYLRMKEYDDAKMVLKHILAIDSNYRLAKERLEQLNAI